MNFVTYVAVVLLVIAHSSAQAEVVQFCERYLQTTDRPYEMRCIANRSAFANSVRIINNENEGGESAAFFVGKKADNRTMSGTLQTEITPAGRALLFKSSDQIYVFEVFVLMQGAEVLQAYWKVTDRKKNLVLETTNVNCYGSLWQTPHEEPKPN